MKKTIKERLMSKVIIDTLTGCWIWSGAQNGNGYGHISKNGRPYKAHRASYEEHVGPIPIGLDLDHLCRNRICVNYKHLEPVTRQENLRRSPLNPAMCGGKATSRIKNENTHCRKGHPYSLENIYLTRRNWRVCRECKNQYENKRYHSKKAAE